LICSGGEVYLLLVPECRLRLNVKTQPTLSGRSLMSRWKTLRFYGKLMLLAFCLRPLPHFRPSPRGSVTS
jgi:hypothetical protein